MELRGTEEDLKKSEDYLTETGVEFQPLSRDVVREETRCTHCGTCVVLCPSGALGIDRATMRVWFDDTKCIVCEICVPACPSRAMEVCF